MRVTKRKTLLILGSWFCFFFKKLIDHIDDFQMKLSFVPCQACSLHHAFTRAQYGVIPPHCLGLVKWLHSLKKHWLAEAEKCSWGSLEVVLPLSGHCLVISGSCREGRKEAERKGRAQKEIKGWGWEMITADYCAAAVHSCLYLRGGRWGREVIFKCSLEKRPLCPCLIVCGFRGRTVVERYAI